MTEATADLPEGSPSPPTDRVVAVLELLLASDAAVPVSEISQRLGLSRSTCVAILGALARHGWVERDTDRAFRPGTGLIPLANAVLARVPILDNARDVLDRLHVATRLDATLSRVDRDDTTMIYRVGQDSAGTGGPNRLPIVAPLGAVVVAFRTTNDQERWLRRAPDDTTRAYLGRFLDTIRSYGVGIWRFDEALDAVIEAMRVITSLSGDHGAAATTGPLQQRLTDAMLRIGRFGYLEEELRSTTAVPVSFIAAPVFGQDGYPQFELELHVLQQSVRRADLGRLVEQIHAAADELTDVCGGSSRSWAEAL